MTTKHYQNIGISTEIVDKGNFCKVQIGREWSNVNEDDITFEAILTFDKQFSCRDHAKVFMTTKIFKAVLKAVEKNQLTYNQ